MSSAILSTTITSLFGLLSNRKKDYLENITKERKEWRDYLRNFIENISKYTNIKDVEQYI